MLKSLSLKNIGPAPFMDLDFGDRLNILTGDNGLGKSFLLDIIWWSLTRTWPAEVNPKLIAGKKAIPLPGKKGEISFEFTGKSTKDNSYTSTFDPKAQAWTGKSGRPAIPGLVLYAMSDGSFAAWDPARNYWRTKGGIDIQERLPAYLLSPNEVWDGKQSENGQWLCNGLIRDWASWCTRTKDGSLKKLTYLLKKLSPTKEIISPGALTRIGLDDVREMPTIRMPYGQDVAVVHASSGLRRIIALAYFLLWVWKEHNIAAQLIHELPANQVIFLIDEIESHLHPNWQKTIVPSVLSVMKVMHAEASIQLITATHSPLIMSSVEPIFDTKKDAWFDLDYEREKVVLTKRDFEKHGDANAWLVSEAFDLKSSRANEYEALIEKAAAILESEKINQSAFNEIHRKLVLALDPKDDFFIRWLHICRSKGLIK